MASKVSALPAGTKDTPGGANSSNGNPNSSGGGASGSNAANANANSGGGGGNDLENLLMMDDDSQEGGSGPVSSFQSLQAEGDLLAKQGDLRKAIEAYSKALHLRPGDKNCLVSRAKCFLHLGDPKLALADAETSLKEDKDFFKGKFYKAEALYAMGDFEMALVYYHRGHNLRPELDEFRLGIQKAREAIDNSIGNPRDYKLKAPPQNSIREIVSLAISGGGNAGAMKNYDVSNGASNAAGSSNAAGGAGNMTASSPLKKGMVNKQSHNVLNAGAGGGAGGGAVSDQSNANSGSGDNSVGGPTSLLGPNSAIATLLRIQQQHNEKQLLGELYADKEYLQGLLEDRDFITSPADPLYHLVREGLVYLETRTEFWRQQKPIYARRKEQHRIQAKVSRARQKRQQDEEAAANAINIAANNANSPVASNAAAAAGAQKSTKKNNAAGKKNVRKAQAAPTPSSNAGNEAAELPDDTISPEEQLNKLKSAFQDKKWDSVLLGAKSLIDQVEASAAQFASAEERNRLLGNIYNLMGKVYLQQQPVQNNLAVVYFQKDLQLNGENEGHVSRSLPPCLWNASNLLQDVNQVESLLATYTAGQESEVVKVTSLASRLRVASGNDAAQQIISQLEGSEFDLSKTDSSEFSYRLWANLAIAECGSNSSESKANALKRAIAIVKASPSSPAILLTADQQSVEKLEAKLQQLQNEQPVAEAPQS